MRQHSLVLGAALVLLGSVSPSAGQVNTLEYRRSLPEVVPGWVDMEIVEIGKRAGVVLTNEAVVSLRAIYQSNKGEAVTLINRLPIIHLVVSPVPPRDYSVIINGRQYEASEESKYGVNPGPVELVVTRGSLTPCTRNLVVHKNETVRCDL